MINLPLAHVGALPIEETLGSFGPALLVAVGVAWAQLRTRLCRARYGVGGKQTNVCCKPTTSISSVSTSESSRLPR